MHTREHLDKLAIASVLLLSTALLPGSAPVFAEDEGADGGENGHNYIKNKVHQTIVGANLEG